MCEVLHSDFKKSVAQLKEDGKEDDWQKTETLGLEEGTKRKGWQDLKKNHLSEMKVGTMIFRK